MKNPIIDYYKSNLTNEKVKADLFKYLKEAYSENFNGFEYILEIPEITGFETKKIVKISDKDKIKIYQYDSSYKFDTNLYFYVTVGIGKFINRDENGFYGVEKCDAYLKYNFDFSLYDVDFPYCELSEIK